MLNHNSHGCHQLVLRNTKYMKLDNLLPIRYIHLYFTVIINVSVARAIIHDKAATLN